MGKLEFGLLCTIYFNVSFLFLQAVCDADLNILNVVAKYPGSTHDAFIWNTSALCARLEENVADEGWLLGDSGYGLKANLLTPYLNPTTQAERLYNRLHKKARCTIERTFGVLKSRFHCISKFGGALMYSPDRCCNIVVSTAILHNICNRLHIPYDEQDVQRNIPNAAVPEQHVVDEQDGIQTRNQLAMRLLQRLENN